MIVMNGICLLTFKANHKMGVGYESIALMTTMNWHQMCNRNSNNIILLGSACYNTPSNFSFFFFCSTCCIFTCDYTFCVICFSFFASFIPQTCLESKVTQLNEPSLSQVIQNSNSSTTKTVDMNTNVKFKQRSFLTFGNMCFTSFAS